MICDQMGNTIRYFKYREAEWLRQAEKEGIQSEGHKCYAYEQANIWDDLAKRAEKTFGSNAK
jgi:hypothetical protein